jgi:rod shape-determining protein MreB
VRIYKKGKGIVLNEPAVIAVDKNNGGILAVGEEARQMLGRTPRNIIAVRPLKDGVIANFHDTERMLKYFLKKVQGGKSFFKPKAVVCVPSGVTDVEKRSVVQAAIDAGMQHAYLMEEPLSAAIGSGINVSAPFGNMIIDIGAGTADVAVISLGSIVVSDSVKVAGDKFNEAIIQYVQKTHNMLIGASTAEQIK